MKWLVLVVVAACAGAPHTIKDSKKQVVEVATAELFDSIAHKDVEGVERYLTEPVELGGLWFSDRECAKQFPGARKVEGAALAALAKCLATLPLHTSARTDPRFGVVVATYDPGLEVEVAFAYGREDDRPHVRALGFLGRRDAGDTAPTVTPAVLESRRVAGDRVPALDGDADAAMQKQVTDIGMKQVFAWFKICVGSDGHVTSVNPREASSPLLVTTYDALIKQWQFEPFKLGDQPTPVCTLEKFLYPIIDTPEPHEILPWPNVTATSAGLLHVPAHLLWEIGRHRVSLNFTLGDQEIVEYTGTHFVEGAVGICVDEHGSVFETFLLEPTGFPDYDQSIQRDMRTWHYRPVSIGGVAMRVCTAVRIRQDLRRMPWYTAMLRRRQF